MRLPKNLTRQVSTKITIEDDRVIQTWLKEMEIKYPDGDMPRNMTEFLRAAARYAMRNPRLFEAHIKNAWQRIEDN